MIRGIRREDTTLLHNDSITTTPDLRIRHTLAGVPNSIQRTAGILYISTRYHTVFP